MRRSSRATERVCCTAATTAGSALNGSSTPALPSAASSEAENEDEVLVVVVVVVALFALRRLDRSGDTCPAPAPCFTSWLSLSLSLSFSLPAVPPAAPAAAALAMMSALVALVVAVRNLWWYSCARDIQATSTGRKNEPHRHTNLRHHIIARVVVVITISVCVHRAFRSGGIGHIKKESVSIGW